MRLFVVICFQFSIFEPLDTTKMVHDKSVNRCDLLSI